MTSPHADRLARLRTLMRDTGTDLVAIGPSSHMMWLTGLDPHGDERPVMLLVGLDHAGFLMPALNAAAARRVTDLPLHCWTDDAGPEAALAALVTECGATTPGLSVVLDETMRADFALRLLGALDAPRHRFSADTLGRLRAAKDAAEYAALKASAALNDAAVTAAFDALREGMTELDLQDIIHAFYKAHGARAEFTIIGFGESGAYPHHHTGDTRLAPGMAVLIDSGCRHMGYPSDMTRCGWFGGAPDPEFLHVAGVVERAVQAALAIARPGVRAAEIDRAARGVIEEAGYGERFVHRTGHGLGLDVHEPPYISATSEAVLEAGCVFSIEPGIYLEGRFGVRLEDIVILREDGAEILSGLSRALREA